MTVDVIWFSFEPEHQNLLHLINLSVCFHLADFHCDVKEEWNLCTGLPIICFTLYIYIYAEFYLIKICLRKFIASVFFLIA